MMCGKYAGRACFARLFWLVVISSATVLRAAGQPASALSPASGLASDSSGQAPAPAEHHGLSMLAVLSPAAQGEAVLIPGRPEDVFPKLVEGVNPPTASINEAEWLKTHKIKALPPQRDPVIAPDYARPPIGPAFLYRLDRLSSDFPGAQTIQIKEGRAEAKYIQPGPYCLVLRTNPPQTTYFTAGGPMTLVRPDSWAPLPAQLYITSLKTLDATLFWTLLSPARFSQIHPLVERLRSKASLQSTELFLFYRGYFEALALSRWLEKSPEGRLKPFLEYLRSSEPYMDKIVAEALEQESLVKSPPGFAGAFKEPPPPPSPPSPPSPPASAASKASTGTMSGSLLASAPAIAPPAPSLARYKSFYHAGMAAFFTLESTQKTIPGAEGEFFHPDLSSLYEEQYHHFAALSLDYARQAEGANPLIPALETYLQEQAPQSLTPGGSPNGR